MLFVSSIDHHYYQYGNPDHWYNFVVHHQWHWYRCCWCWRLCGEKKKIFHIISNQILIVNQSGDQLLTLSFHANYIANHHYIWIIVIEWKQKKNFQPKNWAKNDLSIWSHIFLGVWFITIITRVFFLASST